MSPLNSLAWLHALIFRSLLTKTVFQFQGQRIIGQAFELFYRLITGGTLPAGKSRLGRLKCLNKAELIRPYETAYNITRPLSVVLQAGILGPPHDGNWTDADGNELDWFPHLDAIARGYERCGFMRLVADPDSFDYYMGRSVDPADYTAAPGDMAIVPPNPPSTDDSTPTPQRVTRDRQGNKFLPGRTTPVSPSFWRSMRNVSDDGSHTRGDNDGGNDGGGGSGNGGGSSHGSNDDDQPPTPRRLLF